MSQCTLTLRSACPSLQRNAVHYFPRGDRATMPFGLTHMGHRDVCAHVASSSGSDVPRLGLSVAPPAEGPSTSPRLDRGTSEGEEEDDVLIEFRNVHKAFGPKKILRGASFKIRRGEAVGIIGGSGTGKSTTLKLATGLLAPDQGEVVIKGRPRQGLLADDEESSHLLKVGLVFQSAALFDSLTVGENVGFLLYEHSNLPEDEIQRRVQESLARVGLRNVEHLYPAALSGGMKKRVALARAVIPDEEASMGVEQVIMYDEPTAGLDPVASTVVEDLMRRLHTEGSGSISSYIVVTHQHSTIRRATDRVIYLHEGRVVWEGTTPEFDTTEDPYVVQFREGLLDGPLQYK